MDINLAVKPTKATNKIILFLPIVYLVVLIVISYFVAKTGYAKIKSQRSALASAKKVEAVLSEKESTLKAASAQLPQYLSKSSLALPHNNPALILISQMKILISQYPVSFSDFKIGAGTPGEFNQVSLSYVLAGAYTDVLGFLKAAEQIAPLTSLNKLEIGLSGDTASADVGMRSFWARFPDKLPAVTDPIVKLSSTNMDALNKVSNLTSPVFTVLSPQPKSSRTNPFF